MEELIPPLVHVWSSDVTGGVGKGSPVVVDSLVFVGTLRGELYVLDARNGVRRGWVSLCGEISGSPATADNIVYVAGAGNEESLIAFDVTAGTTRWRKSYGDMEVSPLLSRGRLYQGNLNGVFHCVEAATGESLWSFATPGNTRLKGIRSTAAMLDSTVVFGSDDGSVYALDTRTGKMRWSYATGSPVVAPIVAEKGRVYAGNLGGEVLAFGLATGSVDWKRTGISPIHAGVALSEDAILVGGTDGIIRALHRVDGSERWKADLGSVINAAPVIAGGYAYVGTLGNALFGINISSGEVVFKQQMEGRIKTPPAVAYGMLVVGTDDRMVQAFRPEGRK
jgi:outer membrane protein assembly factor BamB